MLVKNSKEGCEDVSLEDCVDTSGTLWAAAGLEDTFNAMQCCRVGGHDHDQSCCSVGDMLWASAVLEVMLWAAIGLEDTLCNAAGLGDMHRAASGFKNTLLAAAVLEDTLCNAAGLELMLLAAAGFEDTLYYGPNQWVRGRFFLFHIKLQVYHSGIGILTYSAPKSEQIWLSVDKLS